MNLESFGVVSEHLFISRKPSSMQLSEFLSCGQVQIIY